MSLRIIYIKVSQASILLPVITGLINYRRLDRPFRILFYFFLASIGFEVQASILKVIYHNNMPGLHLFTFVEFLVFSTVYYLHFHKSGIIRLVVGINMIIFIVIALVDALFINNIWNPNTWSRSYASVSLICYTLIYFYYLFSRNVEYYSWEYPMFWVNVGVLIYFGLNLFYFMLIRYLIDKATNTATLSLFTHAAINILANCLYAQSFRCFKKRTEES